MHIPVLLDEILEAFAGVTLKLFVDATVGGGGHSAALLEHHPEIEWLLGIDQDPTAVKAAVARLASWRVKVAITAGNFSDLSLILDSYKMQQVDGILLDLGISSLQLEQAERGFSFLQEGPLDMRMDPSNPLTAAEIVNTWSAEELGRIFRDYGEEKKWRAAARAIVKLRQVKPLRTTHDLGAALKPVLFRRRIHPLTLVFQALRICVNGELEALEQVLPQAVARLRPGGRLAVISFHSLEDRIVKHFFKGESKKSTLRLLTKKPIIASKREQACNPRSRSAKLRVVERL